MRKIESRLPAGLKPSDLGESVESADAKYALVSFFSSPLCAGHENTYVLFVSDPALAASIKSFEWSFHEDGAFPFNQTTAFGEITYPIENIGNLSITVQLLDAGGTELGKLSMVQEVGVLNPSLETQIKNAIDQPGPGVSNIDAMRELVNDYYSYYQSVKLQAPEADDAFKRFICTLIFNGVLKRTRQEREESFNQLADSLDNNADAFPIAAAQGIGVCELRLALLAMNYPQASPLLPWTELPDPPDKNAFADEQLRQKLAALSEADKIDLVNLARFPKTNIVNSARIIENLRNKYFGGASFNDVMSGMNGTREHWILKHYSQGPIAK